MNTLPPTTPRGALTPGLASLLDETIERDRVDTLKRSLDIYGPPLETEDQLALFQANGDGTFTSFEGEKL